MPELPEVETIKRELERAVLRKKIIGVKIHNPKVIKQPKREGFVKGLKNTKIKSLAFQFSSILNDLFRCFFFLEKKGLLYSLLEYLILPFFRIFCFFWVMLLGSIILNNFTDQK